MSVRAFIALELPKSLYESLNSQLAEWKQSYPEGINWVRPENLHLTVLFLGEVEEVIIPELREALKLQCRNIKPFMLGMNGFELFPPKQIRMIWAQLRAENNELAKFNRRLLFETINLGLNPDPKELRLHITMGRIKAPQSPAMQRSILETSLHTDLLPFDTLSLYKSVLQPQGPQYTLLEQIKL